MSRQGHKVVVCEKARVAGEQSSRNWGWIRQQGLDEAELPIMMESIRLWENLAREIGKDVGFQRRGSLYLCDSESEIPSYDHFRSFAPNYGLQSELINSDKLYSLVENTPRHWVAALHRRNTRRDTGNGCLARLERAGYRERFQRPRIWSRPGSGKDHG